MLPHQKYLLALEKKKKENSNIEKQESVIPEFRILHENSGIQVLEFSLKKGESITTKVGTMVYRESKIKGKWGKALGNQKTKEGSLVGQLLSGGDVFYNNYENTGAEIKRLGIAPKKTGMIQMIQIEPKREYILYNQCLLCCTSNISISGKLKMDFVGGNLIAETVKCIDNNLGAIWIHSLGMIDKIFLKANEEIYLNNKILIAYENKSIQLETKLGDVRGEGIVSLITAKKDTIIYIQTHKEIKEVSKMKLLKILQP